MLHRYGKLDYIESSRLLSDSFVVAQSTSVTGLSTHGSRVPNDISFMFHCYEAVGLLVQRLNSKLHPPTTAL